LILIVLRRATLASVLLTITLGVAFGVVAVPAAVKKLMPEGPLARRIVAIDPGHGGVDGGASHPESRMLEKDITLDVSRKMRGILSAAGAKVVLTRVDDTESDLPDRAELERRSNIAIDAKADIFVSVHVNSHPDPSAYGGQSFYSVTSPESRRLAELIQEELLILQTENFRQAVPENHRVLIATTMPAVLIELAFLSNPTERAALLDPSYRTSLAEALSRGITRYFAGEKANPIIR
jgi:N-acetylmuramoyl-L-alanine amidase